MNKSLGYSIVGSRYQRRPEYNSYLENDPSVLACKAQSQFIQLNSAPKGDVNLSADTTNRVLANGILPLFDRGSRHA